MEGEGLLARGHDLVGGQEEAVAALVAELDGVAVLDAGGAVGVVDAVAGGRVEHAGDAAHCVLLAVDGEEGLVGL